MARIPPELTVEELRRKAEETLAQRPASLRANEPDMQRLLHELQVHQIELEMQNQQLLEAQAELRAYQADLEAMMRQRTADLDESNSRLSQTLFAMERVGIGIHWVDAETGRFTYVNHIAATMLGYTPSEMLELHVSDIDPNFDKSKFADTARRLKQEQKLHFESLNRTKAGTTFPVEVTLFSFPGEDGRSSRAIAFLVDISERKKEELALVHAKEAAMAASVAKSTFLANMSHEIRTPLNAITGMAHAIRRAGLAPEQAERLEKLEAASEHLLGIINAILDLSKIDAGKFELEEVPLRVESLLGNVASMMQERAQAKHLRLLIEARSIPTQLLGDPTRLQQALLNYAANAVKFTEQGTIILRARTDEDRPEDALIRLEVQDTGVGIDPATLPKLFTAFEQADNTTSRQYGGTGLGLAITKKLAQLMGGEAGADSTPGVGSTFWFTARLKKCTAPMSPEAGSSGEDSEAVLLRDYAGRRILLTEDDAINREVSLMMLEDIKLVVDVAEDGVQAVELVTKNAYDLILMDMQMPRMDGLDATREIRKLPNGARVPIVAMTANAFAEDKLRCFNAGMNDFIMKPVKPMLLFETLLKWLSISRA